LSMIEDAESRGVLGPDSLIVEPTSGTIFDSSIMPSRYAPTTEHPATPH
jgi:hypothetical protein